MNPHTHETPPTTPTSENTPSPTTTEMVKAKTVEKQTKSQQELRKALGKRIEVLIQSTLTKVDEYEKRRKAGEFEDKPGEDEGSGDKRKMKMQKELTEAENRINRMKATLDSGEVLPQESVEVPPDVNAQYQEALSIFGTPEHGFKGSYIDPQDQDYETLKNDTDPTKFGEYTLNPDMQNVDFENIPEDKIHIINLPQFAGKPRAEVLEYITKTYPNYKLPGLEYWYWLSKNSTKTPNKLKDTKLWFYFPGSLIRDSGGHWSVPCTSWDESGWHRDARWLSGSWLSRCRVVLLEI